MKKVLIAGILALVSSLWVIAVSTYAALNLTDHWMNFHFLETVMQRGLIVPFALSLAVLLFSVLYLLIAFFRKEK